MMKKRMKRGGMAKKKRVKKAIGGGVMAGIRALKKKMDEKGQGRAPAKRDASEPKRILRKPKMGGGIMKKRMKRGGRAMKRGGGMMKRPMMKRGGKAK